MAPRRAAALAADELVTRSAAIYERDLPTVCVTLADNRAAGNCVEGTLAFAERKLQIPREEILAGGHLFAVPASRLLAGANDEADWVKAAIRRAWLRETMLAI